jgi:hypothetical protein
MWVYYLARNRLERCANRIHWLSALGKLGAMLV